MNKFLSIGQVSKLLSVSLSTLYCWLKTGKIKESFITLGQHRRFNLNQLEQALHLKKLISLILNQQINVLILNHKGRLLRFGSEIIFSLCSFYNVKVIILEEKELSFEQDLVNNVIV